MQNKKDFSNLTDRCLTYEEQYYLASNLNQIEEERERQKHPSKASYALDFIASLIGAVIVLVFGLTSIIGACRVEHVFFGIGILIIGGGIDWFCIKTSWELLKS